MRRTFPELHLGYDLFHAWPVGLRFELNANGWPNIDWEVILQRACTLYEAVFAPGDKGFLVSVHDDEFALRGRGHGSRKMPAVRNSVFALSRAYSLGVHGVAGRKRLTTHQDRDTRIVSTYRWTEMDARRIGYRGILRAIMHTDFPSRRLRITDRVYFVNRTRNIILHMYDDRGMDLIAASVDHLEPIYEQRKEWVLEHNRSSIVQMFEHAADS